MNTNPFNPNQPVIDVSPNGTILPGGFKAYAGFWRRLIAYAVDSLILGVPLMMIGRLTGSVVVQQNASGVEAYTTSTPFAIFAGLVSIAYFVWQESSDKQATIGKNVMGLKVTNLQGGRISVAQALIRYFGKFLSSIIFYVGFFMAGFTEKKQALHDMLAKTLVVRR